MKTNFISSVRFITLALIVGVGISYAAAWSGPSQGAPQGNVLAPLNVGSINQSKIGGLAVGAFTAASSSLFYNNVTVNGGLTVVGTAAASKIKVTTGAGVGKVLQSDAAGNAAWVDVSALGIVTPPAGGGSTSVSLTAEQTQCYGMSGGANSTFAPGYETAQATAVASSTCSFVPNCAKSGIKVTTITGVATNYKWSCAPTQ